MNRKLIEKLEIDDLPEPYRTVAETCGMDVAVELAEQFGGSQIYFQKLDTLMGDLRVKLIKEEFNGYNYNELSKKYGCTARWVRQVTSAGAGKSRMKPVEGHRAVYPV